MSYERQNFENGQVLTATHLNHIEDGIEVATGFIVTLTGNDTDGYTANKGVGDIQVADELGRPCYCHWNGLTLPLVLVEDDMVHFAAVVDGLEYRVEIAATSVTTTSHLLESSGGGITDINIKKWFGKKIIVDGSSITTGGTGLTQPTWSDFLKDMFALSAVYNHAQSGTPWFTYGETNVMSRTEDYETDADAIIIMGDYNGIGTINPDNPGTLDDDPSLEGTYYAKLKYLAESLIEKFPLCPVIWVVEPPRYTGEGDERIPMEHTSRAALQGKAIEEVAEYYGFTHCNLMKNTVFRPWVQANRDATTSDGVHPWNNVQRTMAQVIAETMKRTPLFYNESYVVTPDNSGNSGSDEGKTLTKITADFTQGENAIYVSDGLSVLNQYLRVKAYYSDLSEATLSESDYVLSGELVAGASTITVSYGGQTATFTVTVTEGYRPTSVSVGNLSPVNDMYLRVADGSPTAISGYSYGEDYVQVVPGSTITFSHRPGGLTYGIYYDADKNFISEIGNTFGTFSYTVPDNAHYVRLNSATNDWTVMTYVAP